jgi:polysaccharide pyruvyl transferase WcaK-like protein
MFAFDETVCEHFLFLFFIVSTKDFEMCLVSFYEGRKYLSLQFNFGPHPTFTFSQSVNELKYELKKQIFLNNFSPSSQQTTLRAMQF